MKNVFVHDIAGIGIGPFNLGLAALLKPIEVLDSIFFDAKPNFTWHPGLMLDFAKLQVPFYSDLVTGADPSNPYSFLSYMKQTGRLFQFAILEDNYITRKEYRDYCCWVAGQLKQLRFGHTVTNIRYNRFGFYEIHTVCAGKKKTYNARHVVLGIGSVPNVPDMAKKLLGTTFIHSSSYLENKELLLQKENITVIGSGQSAAEIFYDLLNQKDSRIKKIEWMTRAERLYPMDMSKFSLEMTSPDYIDYFFDLPAAQRKLALERQDTLYKGINQELLSDIYRTLYHQGEGRIETVLRTNSELRSVEKNGDGYNLKFYHREQEKEFCSATDAVVMATGYHRPKPGFIEGIRDRIILDTDGNYCIGKNYSIDDGMDKVFVQNADLHSHGFNAPDLGMGTYRNAVILNAIMGYDYFMVEKKIAFQSFGI